MEMDSEPVAEPPLTLSAFNVRRTPRRIQTTIFGKVRAFNTFTVLEWTYLIISLVALVASFGLSMQRLVSQELDSSDFTFAILLMLTIAFCCYYVGHSVLTERGDELLVFVVSNAIVLIYCIMNYVLQENTRSTIKLARLIVVCVVSPFLIGIGILQSIKYCRSNNLIFDTVGSIYSLQKACMMFFWCSSLLKFDLQLQLSMLILVMGSTGAQMDLSQKVILGSGVILTVIFISLGFIGLRRENHIIMVVFYVLGLFEPGYVAYKFYYAENFEKESSATYESTYACGCFALVVWLALMGCTGYFITHHFGKGLRERMHGYVSNTGPVSSPVESPDTSVQTQ